METLHIKDKRELGFIILLICTSFVSCFSFFCTGTESSLRSSASGGACVDVKGVRQGV